MSEYKLKLFSDFNITPLEKKINQLFNKEKFSAVTAPFGEVLQNISQYEKKNVYSGLLFWTRPENLISEYAKALEMKKINEKDCFKEIDYLSDVLIKISKYNQIFFVKWNIESENRGYGLLDWKYNTGLKVLLAKLNIYLSKKLEKNNNIYILDFDSVIYSGSNNFSKKLWYTTKIPFSDEVFTTVSNELKSAIDTINGKSKKLIILDLDNTLWGGVVGEVGYKKIRLGGHDYIGEAFQSFQKKLKALSNSGIQLAICSKNDEHVAMKAIEKHSEMILRKKDFISWKINWKPKSENIREILEEVNLGKSSSIFIDDNPAERENVKITHPEILVPHWDDDATESVSRLNKIMSINYASVTEEDRNRKKMYITQAKRLRIKKKVKTEDVWLKKLSTTVTIKSINNENITRTIQLFNKTNQLNLSTRRFTEEKLRIWLKEKNRLLKVIYVKDKFGDLGLVGIIGIIIKKNKAILSDYVLSCRVMGRKIEELMIYLSIQYAKKFKSVYFEAKYIKTQRNRPTLDIFRNSNLEEIKKNYFITKNFSNFKKPNFLKVK